MPSAASAIARRVKEWLARNRPTCFAIATCLQLLTQSGCGKVRSQRLAGACGQLQLATLSKIGGIPARYALALARMPLRCETFAMPAEFQLMHAWWSFGAYAA